MSKYLVQRMFGDPLRVEVRLDRSIGRYVLLLEIGEVDESTVVAAPVPLWWFVRDLLERSNIPGGLQEIREVEE